MDPYDSPLRFRYSPYNPFPHSLLRTRVLHRKWDRSQGYPNRNHCSERGVHHDGPPAETLGAGHIP